MFLIVVICCAVIAALSLHYIVVAQKRFIAGPEGIFLLMGVGTFAATLHAAGQSGSIAHPYCNFIGVGLLAFILGTAASRYLFRFRHREALKRFVATPWTNDLRGLQLLTALTIGAVALIVTFTYFYLLGFFVPLAALQGFFASGNEGMNSAYTELRRESSATGDYLGAGYVFQFKNCLLPLVTFILYYRMRIHPSRANRLLFTFFLASTVMATIGTGSRFALAFFVAAFMVIGSTKCLTPFRFSFPQLLAGAIILLLALSALTFMMGNRGRETVSVPLLWAPYQVLDRVFIFPAHERFAIYELFMKSQEPQMGRDALERLKILLPGRAEYTLPNQLHEMLYGSSTGNAGPDLWGSLWYDFHWFGLPILFVMGFLYNWFYINMLRGPKRFIRVITLLYAGLILGLASDLFILILQGFPTCIIFLFLVNCSRYFQSALRAPTESPVIESPHV